MWRKLSISVKLITSLLIMQIMFMVGGGFLLINKIERIRLKELDGILETKSDVLEETFTDGSGGVRMVEKGEIIQEFTHDPNLFFQISSADGSVILESQGPAKEIRDLLSKQIETAPARGERQFTITIRDNGWRVAKEKIGDDFKSSAHNSAPYYLSVGLNVTSAMKDLRIISHYIIGGMLLLLLATAAGTFIIVYQTTTNLTRFAASMAHINPEKPFWKFAVKPNSYEETHLFSCFCAMIHAMGDARDALRLFIANASHELKTPVAGLLTALEVLLARRRTAEEYETSCRQMLKVVRDMKKLTDTLLNMSILEKAGSSIEKPVDIKNVVMGVKERLTPLAQKKGITIQENFLEDNILAFGHPELLGVAIGNIVENAIKYSHQEGKVEIIVDQDTESNPSITVKDMGEGMSDEDIKKLGTPFFRVDKSRTDKGSFGLGFSHADKIIASFGGSITVKSCLNAGTEVTINLPCAANCSHGRHL